MYVLGVGLCKAGLPIEWRPKYVGLKIQGLNEEGCEVFGLMHVSGFGLLVSLGHMHVKMRCLFVGLC